MEAVRVRFMEKAAHLSYTRSPSTSAHLLVEKQALMRSSPTSMRSQSVQACQRCGTIALSVWKPQRAVAKSTKKSSRRKSPAKHMIKTVVRRCDACGRVAKLSIDPKAQLPRSLKVRDSLSVLAGSEFHSFPSSNFQPREEPRLSSKKRAKARKDREGLQAMLHKQKPKLAAGQMTFMDFMKP